MENTTGNNSDGAVTASRIHFLSIIGQIEGHYLLPEGQKGTKYEHMLPALAEIEQRDDIDGLLLLIIQFLILSIKGNVCRIQYISRNLAQ